MPTQVLNSNNFAAVPFRNYVQKKMELAFDDLIRNGILRINFAGSDRNGKYQLHFLAHYSWTIYNRDRNWYRPGFPGTKGQINLDALQRRNYCRDVGNSMTCEPVVRNTADELGYSIAVTAVHEAAHLFGLDHGGPDGSGHSPDPRNYMFINSLHSEYLPFLQDHRRTIKYRIIRGDTLSGIAYRIGFCPPLATWRTLYDFRGKDGRRNRDLLRSHNPDLIYPGEEIWIPDIPARLAYMRRLEILPKTFTSSQLTVMRQFLSSGRMIMQTSP